MSSRINRLYEFEDFRLDAENKSLWRRDIPVSISPKALDTLILLVERKGELVLREDLLDNVWRETFVEEGNINYTISLLRKTLGNKELVQTVPRRGYRFVADVKQTVEDGNAAHLKEIQSPRKTLTKNRSKFFIASAVLFGVLVMTLFGLSWRNSRASAAPTSEDAEKSLQAYKRGMMIMDDKDVQNRPQKALDEFQKAVTLDPTSALAYAGLAEALASKGASATNDQSDEIYAQAKIAVDKSFALNNDLFEAHMARGWIRRNGDWNWSGAEEDLKRAVEIDPNSGTAHYRYSQLLAGVGRYSEAHAEINRAREINPLSEIIRSGQFPLYESAGEYEKALKLAEEYLRDNSENPFALRAVGTFQYHLGQYEKVVENGEKALEKNDNRNAFAWFSLLAAAYSKIGQPDKADEMLRKLEIQSHMDKRALYSLAMNYAELGRIDEALTALEKCYEVREQRMMWVAVEPRFANLKNEPRFRALLAKMRLS